MIQNLYHQYFTCRASVGRVWNEKPTLEKTSGKNRKKPARKTRVFLNWVFLKTHTHKKRKKKKKRPFLFYSNVILNTVNILIFFIIKNKGCFVNNCQLVKTGTTGFNFEKLGQLAFCPKIVKMSKKQCFKFNCFWNFLFGWIFLLQHGFNWTWFFTWS